MPPSPEQLWTTGLDQASSHLPTHARAGWLDAVHPVGVDRTETGLRLHLQVPSQGDMQWIREKYASVLIRALGDAVGQDVELAYTVCDDPQDRPAAPTRSASRAPVDDAPRRSAERAAAEHAPPQPRESSPAVAQVPPPAYGLNDSYIFSSFIEGDCNQLARSAALAIAEQPGSAGYNPFLVYGGVGLGKTHLAQAIGNHVCATGRDLSVCYVSSEMFTSQFVQAIQSNDVATFSMRYRQIDLLIVDDVQFFGGKEKTQEEFFHIFNALHQAGKQIVLCADRSPREIPGIEERLLSRFRWGLTADVQVPDLETRIAILQHKAEDNDIVLPSEVAHYIAQHVTQNIRSLEGALNRLTAFTHIHGSEIDLQAARTGLADILDHEVTRNVKVEDIQEVVADYFRLSRDVLSERTRKREIVTARHIAMYLSKEMTSLTLKSIGMRFGGRDHSTVIHAHRTVEDRLELDEHYNRDVRTIRKRVEALLVG